MTVIAYEGHAYLTRRLRNLALDLWEESYLEELQQLWKAGRCPPKPDKRTALIKNIDGHWQTAEVLAAKAGISHKSAVKLLQSMAQEGEIELMDEYWTDDRFRRRKRYLYRKRPGAEGAILLSQLLGITAPPENMVFTNYVVRHLMEDDEDESAHFGSGDSRCHG